MQYIDNVKWDFEIRPRDVLIQFRLKEIWRYRDLLLLLVKRDFVTYYKQTILGPLWFIIQPLFTTAVFTLVFGKIAKIPTDNLPPMLFYLAGITSWNYFANCFKSTSATFTNNANLFSKVYFPRIIVPLSVIISNLINFAIQVFLLIGFVIFFSLKGAPIHPNWTLVFFPILVLTMGVMGLSLGMLTSAMTVKYRDLNFLVQFGIQLLMYATPVVYPSSIVPEQYRWIVSANPMTPIIDTFRHSFLGAGTFTMGSLIYSIGFTLITFILSLIIFNRTEKNFMDTV